MDQSIHETSCEPHMKVGRRRRFSLIALVIIVGIAYCGVKISIVQQIGPAAIGYLGAICVLILFIAFWLGPFRAANCYMWAMLVYLIVGTIPKITWLANTLSDPFIMARDNPELRFVTYPDLSHALRTTTLALGMFALVVWAFPAAQNRPRSRSKLPTVETLRKLLIVTAILATISVALCQALHLGVLGEATRNLPLGLSTIITRTRSDIAPDLALLSLYYAINLRRFERTALALNVGLAIASAFVTTSRGTVLLCAVSIFVLYSISHTKAPGLRRMRIKPILLRVGAILAVGLLLFPLLSSIRTQQLTDTQSVPSSNESIADIALLSVTRVQGADGILQTQHADTSLARPSIGTLFSGSQLSLAPYYTAEVVGVTRPNDFRSPGVIGAAFLLGGSHWWPIAMLALVGLFFALGRILMLASPAAVIATLLVGYAADFNEGLVSVYPGIFFVAIVFGINYVHRRLISVRSSDRSRGARTDARSVRRQSSSSAAVMN